MLKVIFKIDFKKLFVLLFILTLMSAIGILASSVSLYFDKVLFVLMLIVFILSLAKDLRYNKDTFILKARELFCSAKMIFILLALYITIDIITYFYTKNVTYVFQKLLYMFEYFMIFVAGLYYVLIKKSIVGVIKAIALVGLVVSVITYICYFFLVKPTYFQRLSTANDYNVFACVMFFSIIMIVTYIINFSTLKFYKKIIVITLLIIVEMPVYYLAGSRRMVIMLPYFFIFTLLYEILRFARKDKKVKDVIKSLTIIFIVAILYILSSAFKDDFAKYGEYKEEKYKEWLHTQIVNGNSQNENELNNFLPEKTIESILQTIEDNSMTGKRKIIYKTAFIELSEFSILELIFGKGASYDVYMYDKTIYLPLLSEYGYDLENRPDDGWMSAHNFLISDILSGGLIKMFTGLTLVFFVIYYAIKAAVKDKKAGLYTVIPVALIVPNNFISGKYGFLNDLFFFVSLVLIIGTLWTQHLKKESLSNE